MALAALAGYVDAVGFVATGGFFVSFMSGNSTRVAVGLADALSAARIAGGLIAAFVVGVMAGSLVARRARRGRARAVLLLVAALLACAAGVGHVAAPAFAIPLLAAAMGAENAVFEREGEVSIGVTYMTGSLVKLGQRLTAALLGEQPLAWVPYLTLWLGLVSGAVAGALAYPVAGLAGLWLAVGAALILAWVGARIDAEARA